MATDSHTTPQTTLTLSLSLYHYHPSGTVVLSSSSAPLFRFCHILLMYIDTEAYIFFSIHTHLAPLTMKFKTIPPRSSIVGHLWKPFCVWYSGYSSSSEFEKEVVKRRVVGELEVTLNEKWRKDVWILLCFIIASKLALFLMDLGEEFIFYPFCEEN
jgi:hypothetical protein